MYIRWNHFALYMKLIQYCKTTIVQLKKKEKDEKDKQLCKSNWYLKIGN